MALFLLFHKLGNVLSFSIELKLCVCCKIKLNVCTRHLCQARFNNSELNCLRCMQNVYSFGVKNYIEHFTGK